MSTKFFTNHGDNTLFNKFKGIFQDVNVHTFDVLVGFFRSSGYFRIREYLDKVQKIRILVGIDVDYLTSKAANKGLEFTSNDNITREEFVRRFKKDIEQSDYSKEVEEGIIQFVEDITSGKVEIKAHPNKNIHAKIYIFRPKGWSKHKPADVITGSSNLSISGIEKNFEFNVWLRDCNDVEFATETFEELWAEATDILPETVQNTVKKSTHLSEDFTPFQIYIKLLIEYFGKTIDYDKESIIELPEGYKKLAYQTDAVNDGYAKLMKHNGFILADVVGLGKTIIATSIAKKFFFANGERTKILIVYPPAVEKNWKKIIKDFNIPNIDFISNGSLHKINQPKEYDLIIVDEAHKFRSDSSKMFEQLQKICKTPRTRKGNDLSDKKKIILITATPLNNKPQDIRTLLYLFLDSKMPTLEVANLDEFFAPLIRQYRELTQNHTQEEIAQSVKDIYQKIRNKVLEPIIVRRTRTDIKNTPSYLEDMKKQGVTFPEILAPKPILYQLDDEVNDVYDKSIKAITDKLHYHRYQAIMFLNRDAKRKYERDAGLNHNQSNNISNQLAAIMRTLLVKRIDSSFYAFKMSLERFYNANKAMLKMIENGTIYIAPKLNVNDFVLNDKETELEDLLTDDTKQIHAFGIQEFSEELIKGIKEDDQTLKTLVDKWAKIDKDPKYDKFVEKLKTDLLNPKVNESKKLVVFSESKETASYLKERLEKDGFKGVLSVDSSNSKDLTDIIAQNFDANLKSKSKKDYDIIITTEVLAEGVNLHRANTIVNYDIPWNATRLMQRIGRVNRVGTPYQNIYIYNFFPTEQADNEIQLNKKAFIKLQAFHSALGEDSQIYSTKEDFDSFGLFEKLPEEERDERLEYLNFLRQFKEEQPEQYQYIKNKIPKRARCARKNTSANGQTITYIKGAKRDIYYLIHADNTIEELTFVEAARRYKAESSEASTVLPKVHYDQINTAVNAFLKDQNTLNLGPRKTAKLTPNENRAVQIIRSHIAQDYATQHKELLAKAREAIQIGQFKNLHKEINKLKKDNLKLEDEFEAMIQIIQDYLTVDHQKSSKDELVDNSDPQIIISESFTA